MNTAKILPGLIHKNLKAVLINDVRDCCDAWKKTIFLYYIFWL
jgi:hypothetical protein